MRRMLEQNYKRKKRNQNGVCVGCGNIDGDGWNLKYFVQRPSL
jgi:hypothetical protein